MNSKPSAPSWLPNWEDDSLYPAASAISPSLWAWQFLRRNTEYQKLWDQLIAPFVTDAGGFDVDASSKWAKAQGRKYPGFIDRGDRGYLFWTPDAWLEKKFGIRCLPTPPAPDVNAPQFFFVRGTSVKIVKPRPNYPGLSPDHLKTIDYPLLRDLQPHERAIVVDLRQPLEQQFARAKKWLLPHGETNRRPSNQRGKFPEYLRLLDGERSGASQRRMAKVLYPRQDQDHALERIKKALKRAHELRDGDYLLIVQ